MRAISVLLLLLRTFVRHFSEFSDKSDLSPTLSSVGFGIFFDFSDKGDLSSIISSVDLRDFLGDQR